MFQKLDDVVLKHKELTKMLMDPEVVSDPKKIMEYNKALNSIDEVVRKYTYYKNRREEMEGLKEDLKIIRLQLRIYHGLQKINQRIF